MKARYHVFPPKKEYVLSSDMEIGRSGKCQEEKERKKTHDAFSFYFAESRQYCTVILVIANAEISKGRPATANLPAMHYSKMFVSSSGFSQIPQLIRLFGPLRWFSVNLHAIPLAIRFHLHLLPLVLDLLLLSLQVPGLLHRKLPAEYP